MRILIVEDERALCDTLVKSLKQKGYEVDACYDGDSALDWLLTEKYDLLLLDLNLPGRDGMDLLKTLRELLETLGNRRLTLCRELTKKHETAWQTTLEDAITRYEQEDPKGECVLVIEGRSQKEIEDEAKAAFEEISIEEHMKRYEDQGIARKEAMKLVAKDRGVTKRDIYQYLLGKE